MHLIGWWAQIQSHPSTFGCLQPQDTLERRREEGKNGRESGKKQVTLALSLTAHCSPIMPSRVYVLRSSPKPTQQLPLPYPLYHSFSCSLHPSPPSLCIILVRLQGCEQRSTKSMMMSGMALAARRRNPKLGR